MQKIIYITDCSETALSGHRFCEHQREDLKKIKRKTAGSKRTYHFVCPNHGGRIVQRKTTCAVCGIDVYFHRSGNTPTLCRVHQKKKTATEAKAKTARKTSAKPAGKIKKQVAKSAWSQHWRGDYCKKIAKCLNKNTRLTCGRCNAFDPIFINVDPLKLRRMMDGK